jgi:uncharacterized OB-fold protein
MNDVVKPVMEGIFDLGPPPKLIGGHCPECDRKYFPKPTVCPMCQGPVEIAELSDEGSIYSFSVVRTRAPFGLPQSYAIGYVDLDADRLRIISLLDSERLDQLAIGVPVTLRVEVIGVGNDGLPCTRYFFTPKG